jgi:hypothetical protein
MKALLFSAYAMSLLGLGIVISSCAGLKLATQYGTVESDAKGNIVITPIPKPIIIPAK